MAQRKFLAVIIGVLLAGIAAVGYYVWINRQPAAPPVPGYDVPTGFKWGTQLRPYAANRYTDALMDQQLDLAQSLGVKWARLDWHNFNDFAWHDRIIDEANKRGIAVVLILEDIGVPSDVSDAPAKAKARAKEIATHFAGKIRYYQLFNEVSGTILKGPEYPGTDFKRDYDEAKYKEIRDWMKAAIAGIKDADGSAKTVVSSQWTQVAVIEELISDGIKFDIIGWNWFSDMMSGGYLDEPIVAETRDNKITLLEKLKGFGKPLWITELNYRPAAAGMDQTKQAEYLTRLATEIREGGDFEAVFEFELMDQCEVNALGGEPVYYGLVSCAKSGSVWTIGAKKKAFQAYKEVIANNP
jgi:hypothetical protein